MTDRRLPTVGHYIRIALAAAAGTLIVILVAIQVNSFRENRLLQMRVDRSYELQALLDRLLSLHQDVETGQRGYALTGNPEFLQPYETALPRIRSNMISLRQRAGDLQAHVTAIEELSAAKLDFSRQIIGHRMRGDGASAQALVASGLGKDIMDRLRRRIAVLHEGEIRRLQALLRSVAVSQGRTQLSTAAAQILLLGLLAAAFAAYMSNLSRLRRVTSAAHDTSQRQVAIFDAATDAMLVVDARRSVESLNPAALHLFALNESAGVGRHVSQLFENQPINLIDTDEGRSAHHDDRRLADATAMRGDGSTFEAEVAASQVALADGTRTLLIVRDATQRNRIERMKTEFVSTVSHELRTPLTSIRGAITLLEHALAAKLDGPHLKLLTIAKANSERLSDLIDDILSIEKIGSGSLEFEMAAIDLLDVVRQAEEQNRTYAEQLGVRLQLVTHPGPLFIKGDAGRLLQALTNLISNAAKYSPSGGVVSVIAEAVQERARVSVADTGPGIPAEFRPRLFERFSQASGASGRRSGTGLGLAITKAIVDRHGGEIGYDTNIGRGTLFWIELPLAQGQKNDFTTPSDPAGRG